ncbi:MAG: ribosome maturation factor RimM [Ilumatobacteraceae bacterium]
MSTQRPLVANDPPPGHLEVGRFGRPHGVRGQIHLRLSSDRVERVRPGARLWSGRWLEILSSAPTPGRDPGRFVVGIVGIDDRGGAEALVNRTVWAEPIEDDDAVWVHQVIGSQVIGVDGTAHGRCVAVVANPANDLLELASGALVPVVFIVGVDSDDLGGFIVTVDPPAGLFEIFAGESSGGDGEIDS